MNYTFNPFERAIYELDVLTYYVKHEADHNSQKDVGKIYESLLNIEAIFMSLRDMEMHGLKYLADYHTTVVPFLKEWANLYNLKMGEVFSSMSPELNQKYKVVAAEVQSNILLKVLEEGVDELKGDQMSSTLKGVTKEKLKN